MRKFTAGSGGCQGRGWSLPEEWNRKLAVLWRRFEHVPPLEFIRRVLPGNVVVVFEDGWTDGRKVRCWEKEQLENVFPFLAQRKDCYVCYAEYFRGWYRDATMKQVHAFVVDADRVSSEALEWFLDTVLKKFPVQPSYIFASGEGTQFIYVLEKPLEVRKRNRNAVKELYRRLQLKHWALAAKGAKIDIHPLTQAFRLPGTLTKAGYESRVFGTGKPVAIERLETWLGVSVSVPAPVSGSDRKRRKLPENVHVLPRVKHGRKLYDYCFLRALEETQPGHRYLSMFALSVVAWKCQVPKEELEKDLYALRDAWNWKYSYAHPVKESEIRKALRGYGPRATLTKSETLEEWFGWRFRRPSMSKEEQVRRWREAGPEVRKRKKLERMRKVVQLRKQGLTWKEIAQKIGISRNRASELYREALQLGLAG